MTTCENFGTYSHEQIRHEMYDGMGPNSQGDAMAGWHELAGRLTAVREYVDSAISGAWGGRVTTHGRRAGRRRVRAGSGRFRADRLTGIGGGARGGRRCGPWGGERWWRAVRWYGRGPGRRGQRAAAPFVPRRA